MARRHLATAGSLFLLSLGIAAVPGPAYAAHVACGQTLLVSTVLDGNVGPCAAGIVVGADNITLDLNGFTVSGTPSTGEGPGILLPGRTGVTVRNGTVTQFDNGVSIESGSGNTVTRMQVVNNRSATATGTGYGEGVGVYFSNNNSITNNLVRNNGQFSGVRLASSSFNLVDGNDVMDNNQVPFRTTGIRIAVILQDPVPSTDNTVSNNRVVNSGFDGIAIFPAAARNQIKSNQVVASTRSGVNVDPGANANVIEGNQTRSNGGIGIFLRPPQAGFPSPADNQILRNSSFGNTFGDLRDGDPNCGSNQWHGNQAAIFTPPCTMKP